MCDILDANTLQEKMGPPLKIKKNLNCMNVFVSTFRVILYCEVCDVYLGLIYTCMLCHTLYSDKASLHGGSSDAQWDGHSHWRLSHTPAIWVSVQYELTDIECGINFHWRVSHTPGTWTVSVQYELADVECGTNFHWRVSQSLQL